jgi:hypothetical protein
MLSVSLGGLLLLLWLVLALEAWRGWRSVPVLRELPERPEAHDAGPLPRVSLIAAARNEAPGLADAVSSWLALDYPALQLVLVDDRSTDQTGQLLEQLARHDPRVTILHVTDLPAGWLGKTHALALGAAHASGDWLLFTDADVRFHPKTLRQAIGYALREGCDHVTCLPQITGGSWWLASVEVVFLLTFVLWVRPHRVPDPRHAASAGVGAFNLVRAAAYRAIGGHQRLALRPDDDIKLGQLLKRQGFRQRLVDGSGSLAVPWYASLRAMARGLEKNIYAACDYRLWRFLLMVLSLLGLFAGPWVGVALAPGIARWLCGGAAAIGLLLALAIARRAVGRWHAALGMPVSALILTAFYIRSVYLTLRRGGILWRESFYPLAELRRHRV